MFSSIRICYLIILFPILLLSDEAPLKIMPLGDSITYDSNHDDKYVSPRPVGVRNGYRNDLWYKLIAAGYHVDFVGSQQAGQSIVPRFDVDNEGHPGWTSYQIAYNIYTYLIYNTPDIILLHIGSNDNASSVAGVEYLLDEIDRFEEDNGHHITVIVALIIDRNPHSATVSAFNHNLKNLVKQRISEGDDLMLVDMQYGAGIQYSKDMADHIHPNDRGYTKMANVWFKAIVDYKKSQSDYINILIPIYNLLMN